MECPACGAIHHPRAEQCECGHNFGQGVLIPKEPFVAIPSATTPAELESISQCFSASGDVEVIYGHRLPVMRAAPIGGTEFSEFTGWLVAFGPDLFKQIAFWTLATYTGKKVVDGFAVEAGKDLWKGVKALAGLILAKNTEAKGNRLVNVHGLGIPTTGSPIYNVRITFEVPAQRESLSVTYDQIERILFPLIGCLSENSKEVRLQVYPGGEGEWPWELFNFKSNTLYGLDLQEKTFQNRGFRQETDETTETCLKSLGFQVARTSKMVRQRRWWKFW